MRRVADATAAVSSVSVERHFVRCSHAISCSESIAMLASKKPTAPAQSSTLDASHPLMYAMAGDSGKRARASAKSAAASVPPVSSAMNDARLAMR